MVLVVPDAFDAGGVVDFEDVGGGEADVVILEHKAAAHGLGEAGPGADPSLAAAFPIAVGAANVDDEDGFGAGFHAVEDVGLGFEVGHGFLGEGFVFAVEDDELGGVEGEADVGLAGETADVREVGGGLTDDGMELRHVGVGGVGSEVGRHAVHVDAVLAEVPEDVAEIAERDAEVGVGAVAAGVVGLEAGLAHDLDGKAEAHGGDGEVDGGGVREGFALRHGGGFHAVELGGGLIFFGEFGFAGFLFCFFRGFLPGGIGWVGEGFSVGGGGLAGATAARLGDGVGGVLVGHAWGHPVGCLSL